MVQVRDVAALTMKFPFKADAAFVYDFKPHVRAQLHAVVLAADVIAVNHGRLPFPGTKKALRLFGERRYFVVL